MRRGELGLPAERTVFAVDPLNLIQIMLAEGKMSIRETWRQTKIIAEIVAFVSVATALSYVKVFSLPQGGSVTAASMVPLIWLSLRRGAKIGLLAGGLYGLVQLVVEPFIYHPAQVLLDYPLAFGALGLAGFFQKRPSIPVKANINVDRLATALFCAISFLLFLYTLTQFQLGETIFFSWIFALTFIFFLWFEERKRFIPSKKGGSVTPSIVGASIGVFGRFCAHLVSGVVFFASYAPVGMNPIIYSAIYNGSYIIPELLVSVYLIYLLVKSGLIEAYK